MKIKGMPKVTRESKPAAAQSENPKGVRSQNSALSVS